MNWKHQKWHRIGGQEKLVIKVKQSLHSIQHKVVLVTPSIRAQAQWSALTSIHVNHPLAFKLFESLLDKLQRHLSDISADDQKLFWEGVKKLLPSCFSVIRNIRKKTFSDKNAIKLLNEVLSVVSAIASFKPPQDIELFPKNIYGWLKKTDITVDLDIYDVVEAAIRSGAQDYLYHVNEIQDCNQKNDEDNLQNIIKVTQLIRSDLQRGIEHYDQLFKE